MIKNLTDKQNRVIRKYNKDVLAWHGYVRFLGLPDLQNNPDVPLEELYVAQSISERYLTTDDAPEENDLLGPVEYLFSKKKIVVLGDPGSGKSTLINWFSWYLASNFSRKLPEDIGNKIPLPLVLRDLDLNQITDLESLINAFLKRPIAKSFIGNEELIFELIYSGRMLILLDGLDEINEKFRLIIKKIVHRYHLQYPDHYLLASSRVVGYSNELDNLTEHKINKSISNSNIEKEKENDLNICYIAPFTNKQISRFAFNWYQGQNNGNDDEASILKSDFVRAISKNKGTQQLARTPHLLTMMALIYRVKSDLPDGRALLYDLIAQAYLQSIDTARKLKDTYSWQDKKRWLARIGFEMQFNREKEQEQSLLVDRDKVLEWIILAMKDTGLKCNNKIAEDYLDWIARRSGLLLPRGEGKFAFLHLSFQEYFAAIYIQQQIENPEWFDADEDIEDIEESTLDVRFYNREDDINVLYNWAKDPIWQQTIILLFEVMALKTGWTKRLWKECFPTSILENIKSEIHKIISNEENEKTNNLNNIGLWIHYLQPFLLQLDLIKNPHSGLSKKLLERELKSIFDYSITINNMRNISSSFSFVFHVLNISSLLSKVLSINMTFDLELLKSDSAKRINYLPLYNLEKNRIREIFTCIETDNIFDLSFEKCDIGTALSDFKFPNLKNLELTHSKIPDFFEFRFLKSISKIEIRDDNLELDIETISSLSKIVELILQVKNIINIDLLCKLKNLQRLSIHFIEDLDGQRPTINIESLTLTNNLKALQILGDVNDDLIGIEKLTNLESIILGNTNIKTFKHFKKLSNLQRIMILHAPVRDVTPLKGLKNLKKLSLYETEVTDVSSLNHLDIEIDGIDAERDK